LLFEKGKLVKILLFPATPNSAAEKQKRVCWEILSEAAASAHVNLPVPN